MNQPNAAIPWKVNAVYDYFERTQGWTREIVDRQLLGRYRNSCAYRPFDPKSIMMVSIPKELIEGELPAATNVELSEGDKQLAQHLYPGR